MLFIEKTERCHLAYSSRRIQFFGVIISFSSPLLKGGGDGDSFPLFVVGWGVIISAGLKMWFFMTILSSSIVVQLLIKDFFLRPVEGRRKTCKTSCSASTHMPNLQTVNFVRFSRMWHLSTNVTSQFSFLISV